MFKISIDTATISHNDYLCTMYRHILLTITVLLTALCAKSQINTDQMLRVGQNALYFDDYMVAIQYFNRVIEAKPYLAQPYFMRAIAKFNLEDFEGAVRDASEAIDRNPFITDAYEVRGVAYQNMGDTDKAIKDYDRALTQLPDNRSILYNKAMALTSAERYEEASDVFNHLLKVYPRHSDGYIARARMEMINHDTIAALADVNKALELSPNSINGYLIRTDINMGRDSLSSALDDINAALQLEPRMAGLYVNRSLIRYRQDDYFGAMADLDYAVELEPTNVTALYNRALLRAEVHDNNKAINDLTTVIGLKGEDYRSLYNRALLYKETGNYELAIKDIDKVIKQYPDFAAAYFLRFDIYREKGDSRQAKRDYDKSLALAKSKVNIMPDNTAESSEDDNAPDEATQEEVSRRFTTLLQASNEAALAQDYNNESIRGRVQDHSDGIDTEPMMAISYYTATTELSQGNDFVRQVSSINKLRELNHLLLATCHVPSLDDESIIQEHFNSIKRYDEILASTTQPRAIDYFGRAMDYMTIHNYEAAISDLDRAIGLVPDFTVAYLVRSYARAKQAEHTRERGILPYAAALADLDKAIELSPDMAAAYYNKGCIFLMAGDFTSALASFTRALELRDDFGEALYNRGYTYMSLGNREAGVADLSKAGQMGIAPSYKLLKRINLR